MSKYSALTQRLQRSGDRTIDLSFREVDDLVGGLPPSARYNRTWWGNSVSGARVQAQAWFAAGRIVEQVNLMDERVRFSTPFASAEAAKRAVQRPSRFSGKRVRA